MASDDGGYVLGRSAAETRRLIHQSQLYHPATRRLLEAAGVGPGMRVLDLGSGAGDVALLAGELVGPGGEIVGVELDTALIDTARARADALGYDHVHFVAGDARALPVAGPFDAVISRFFLVFHADPATLLREVARHLRPGGLVICQEHDFVSPPVSVPESPTWEQFWRWLRAIFAANDFDLALPYRFPVIYRDAGLTLPQLRHEAPVGYDAEWLGYVYAAGTLRSLLPMLERHNIATAAEVNVETFAARLHAEVGAVGGSARATPVVGAWGRTLGA
jgi:SAM-dependent methyltransferase